MTRALADATTPPFCAPVAWTVAERAGVAWASARWTPAELAALVAHLAGPGAAALAAVDDATLLAAWSDTVEEMRDAASAPRRALDPALLRLCALSPAGLAAALDAVLGGVRRVHAAALLARAAGRRSPAPALVVLAGNVPALAVQPLLPALALRKPLLLESSSAEPLFAPAFVAGLAARLPALGTGIAAVTWRGGDHALEAPVLARCDRVLAYGGREAIADLQARAPRVLDYGPKLSVALVAAGADVPATAAGLARDVALFDQRGCLSVQAVLVEGEATARALATALARELAALAATLPPGPLDAALAARVQQLRGEAELRGALAGPAALAAGTVLLAPPATPLAPSPGLRTVTVHVLPALAAAPALLAPWRGLLQGAALAGAAAWALAPALADLGVSRCTEPGALQAADAAWHNGGRDPLEALL